MIVNQILNRKTSFVIVFLEKCYSFLKNLKFAWDIKRVNHLIATVLLFLLQFKNKKQQKTINYNMFAGPENLEDIANRSDSIDSLALN